MGYVRLPEDPSRGCRNKVSNRSVAWDRVDSRAVSARDGSVELIGNVKFILMHPLPESLNIGAEELSQFPIFDQQVNDRMRSFQVQEKLSFLLNGLGLIRQLGIYRGEK